MTEKTRRPANRPPFLEDAQRLAVMLPGPVFERIREEAQRRGASMAAVARETLMATWGDGQLALAEEETRCDTR